jgi:hypothetical protein
LSRLCILTCFSSFFFISALQLRPTYVRALANLAISYANQGLHTDAIRTYLTTLKYNTEANHIWSYLRISLSHLGKDQLVELAAVSISRCTLHDVTCVNV